MTSRVRQYPRVKQRVDRTFASSPANSLLYILSAIRELYNSSNDGRSASDIRELGYDQLVAFLHIDMNCAYPERAALEFFWDRLSPGAIVLLDDYAYFGHDRQAEAIGSAAQALGAAVLSLPTGQGLIIK